jgi:hypothetical protein
MSAANLWADRREFGRRESNIDGYVALPGQVPVACKIVNISDGGALLAFDAPIRLPAAFRLVVEDTSFNLMCEVRHQTGTRAGVRFARLAEGVALNRHFQRAPAEPAGSEIKLQPTRQIKVSIPASNRDLRRTILGRRAQFADDTFATEVRTANDETAPPAIDALAANVATMAALSALAAIRIDGRSTPGL